MTVPRDAVFDRVVRSVKNFAALFVASAFLAGLFLQVASSLQSLGQRIAPEAGRDCAPTMPALVTIKPIFFLAVFLDSLTYSFLPKFMQDAAIAAGLSLGYASMPFTAYYLCFALSLMPAGNFADRYGPKPRHRCSACCSRARAWPRWPCRSGYRADGPARLSQASVRAR